MMFFLLILVQTLVGVLILRVMGVIIYSVPVRLVIGFGAGSGIHGILLFLLLWSGLQLNGGLVWLSLLALLAVAFAVRRKPHVTPEQQEGVRWKPATASEKSCAAVVFVLVLLYALLPLLGPIRGWDAYYYHIPLSREIAQSGSLPTHVSPSYQEMVRAYPPLIFLEHASAIAISTPDATTSFAWLHIIYAFGLLLLLFYTARRMFGYSYLGGLSAVLILLGTELFLSLVSEENIDMGFTFFLLISLFFLLYFFQSRRYLYAVVSGIFLGFSAWTKYHGFIAVALVVGLLAVFAIRHQNKAGLLRAALLVGSMSTLLAAPFLIRNWIDFGNPVYPMLGSVLGGVNISDWSMTFVTPFTAPQLFYSFDWSIVFNSGILSFALFCSWLAIRNNLNSLGTRFFAIFSIMYTIAWVAIMRAPHSGMDRFLLPSVAIFSLLSGQLVARVVSGERTAILRTIIIVGLFAVMQIFAFPLGSARPFFTLLRAAAFAYPLLFVVAGLVVLWLFRHMQGKRLVCAMILFFLCIPGRTFLFQMVNDARALVDRAHGASTQAIPQLEPEATWMQKNLALDARVLTFEDRQAQLPRHLIPADNPAFQLIFTTSNPCAAIEVLLRERIDVVYVNGSIDIIHPLFSRSPVFSERHNTKYFEPLLTNPKNPWLIVYRPKLNACLHVIQ
jgi:hypothetical protein